MKPLVLLAALPMLALLPTIRADPVDDALVLASVYSVPCTGETTGTNVPTVSGLTYSITVSGTCLYGDGAGTFDCYGFSPTGQVGPWYANHQFEVDGINASPDCRPYTGTHTYSLSRPGTGTFFHFNTYDGGGSGDNSGHFTVDVSLL